MERSAREELDRYMTRLAAGDRDAFDPLFARVLPVVRRFVASLLPSAADAEDVAQAALLKVFARAGVYDPKRDALNWILGIAAFEVRSHRRRVERRRETRAPASLESAPDTAARADDAAIARDLVRAMTELMGTLTAQDEEAILAAAELRPRPEISPAAFRKRLERALHRLRHAWKEKHGTE